MTQRALRMCADPGCAGVVSGRGRYCEKCLAAGRDGDAERWRGSARERGYDARWDRFSRWYLAKHPWCVRCGKAAVLVDHVMPRARGGAHCVEENSQAMCRGCHAEKTAEDGREKE